MHPEIEWVNPPDAIETGTRTGTSGFSEAETSFRSAYSSIEIELERLTERGDDVGVITELHFRGRGSGIEVRQRMGMLFTIRREQLVRFEWSNDPESLLTGW
jgi:ketosteroid isomerase-like protein